MFISVKHAVCPLFTFSFLSLSHYYLVKEINTQNPSLRTFPKTLPKFSLLHPTIFHNTLFLNYGNTSRLYSMF